MENLQSEIIFIAKLFGVVSAIVTHYVYVIKPLAVFNERQKQNHYMVMKHDSDIEKIKEDITVLKTKCDKKNSR